MSVTMADAGTGHLRVSLATAGSGGDIHVVRVDGTVDTVTAPELDLVLASLVSQKRYRIVVDLAGVSYVSSAGWGVFVSRLREIREGGGDIKLTRMTADVHEIYDLLEFEGVITHFDRLEAAQAAFNGGNGHTVPSPEAKPVQSSPAPVSHRSFPLSSPLGIPALDAAVLRLVLEDPFYSVREMRSRLGELGQSSPGYWTVWSVLRRHQLLTRRRRFRYFRRHQSMMSTGLA